MYIFDIHVHMYIKIYVYQDRSLLYLRSVCHRVAAQLLKSDPSTSMTILTPYKRQRLAIILQLEEMGLFWLTPRVFVVSGAH